MGQIRILGIGGSLRDGSRTRQALEVALDSAARAGASIELFNLKDHPMPLYDDRKDVATYPKSVFDLLNEVRNADGLILATPVYHGMMSGAMKNALDFLELLAKDEPPWLSGKVAALIAVPGGRSGTNAINGLLHTCQTLRAWVLPKMVVIPGDAFNSDGLIEDQKLIERLESLGSNVAEAAKKLTAVQTLPTASL